jgi:hypothetical protein
LIRICDKEFDASTVVEVYCDNKIPIQPVESGFDVIDHIKKEPLQVVAEVIIFEEGSIQHGRWECRMIDGRMVCGELVRVAPNIGTYKYLVELRDKRKIFLLDASDYSREASMIYPDMAIAHLGQFVLRGGVYRCEITFVQITKHVIVTETLHIYDIDGEIVWSKEPIEPTNTETLETPPTDVARYPPDRYGQTYRIPNIFQFVKGVIDTASSIASGILFGGNI